MTEKTISFNPTIPFLQPEPIKILATLEVDELTLSMFYYPSNDYYKIHYLGSRYKYGAEVFKINDREKAKSKFKELVCGVKNERK